MESHEERCAGLLAQRELAAVDINTPTLFAMQRLVRRGRSAVAVLSPDGKLITNLSSSDLRCDHPESGGVLLLCRTQRRRLA